MAALLIGYARCSTDHQDLNAQRDALPARGVSLSWKRLWMPSRDNGRFMRRTMPGELHLLHQGKRTLRCTPQQQESQRDHAKLYLRNPRPKRCRLAVCEMRAQQASRCLDEQRPPFG